MHQRWLHAQGFVDGVVGPAFEILHQISELVGIALEQGDNVCHCVPGGVVGAGGKQREEDPDFFSGQFVAFVLRLGHPREQVVAGLPLAFLGKFQRESGQFVRGVGEHHQR